MKNIIILYLSLVSVLWLSACHTSRPTQEETFTGIYQSMRGVMNPLSCYCGNGGYLQTATGKKIPVCLKEAEEVSCMEIKVTGNFINRAAPDEPTSPCPPESMSVFMVQEWNCQ